MIHSWHGVRVAVVGLGISNVELIRYLLRQGALVTGCDQKTAEQLKQRYRELTDLNVELRLGDGYLEQLDQFDAVMLTPGMVKDQPPIVNARRAGVYVGSEIGLLLSVCPAKIVGVTGSSGKSTTASLVGAMIAAQGRTVFVGGNIGRPLINVVDEMSADDIVVLELSSFQLELVDRSPDVGAVLNVAPNHLDVHHSYEDYVEAKTNIVRFQSGNDAAVLNRDCPITQRMSATTGGQVHWFGRDACEDSLAYLENDQLVVNFNGKPERLCATSDLPLPGRHNAYNAMAAAAMSVLCGVDKGAMVRALSSFSSLPHRLEVVREVNGVTYVNDSIATAPDRTVAALQAYEQPIVLIAGGYDKKLPFADLGREIAGRAKAVVLIGVTAEAIEQAMKSAGGNLPTARGTGINDAVSIARGFAEPGDIVLLSPACASYDMFANFEQRGLAFREAVRQLAGSEKAEDEPSS